jgi:hypothetical protein
MQGAQRLGYADNVGCDSRSAFCIEGRLEHQEAASNGFASRIGRHRASPWSVIRDRRQVQIPPQMAVRCIPCWGHGRGRTAQPAESQVPMWAGRIGSRAKQRRCQQVRNERSAIHDRRVVADACRRRARRLPCSYRAAANDVPGPAARRCAVATSTDRARAHPGGPKP